MCQSLVLVRALHLSAGLEEGSGGVLQKARSVREHAVAVAVGGVQVAAGPGRRHALGAGVGLRAAAGHPRDLCLCPSSILALS